MTATSTTATKPPTDPLKQLGQAEQELQAARQERAGSARKPARTRSTCKEKRPSCANSQPPRRSNLMMKALR